MTTASMTEKGSQDVGTISRHESHTRCQFPPLNRMPIEVERAINFIVGPYCFVRRAKNIRRIAIVRKCFRWYNLILLLVRWFCISAYYRNKWMVNDGNKFTILSLAKEYKVRVTSTAHIRMYWNANTKWDACRSTSQRRYRWRSLFVPNQLYAFSFLLHLLRWNKICRVPANFGA